MVDWPGLLKWSVNYHDKEANLGDLHQLSKEDQEFIQGAMEEMQFSESKRMSQILQTLNDPEQNKDPEFILNQLEDLIDLLDSLDMGNILVKMGGLQVILKLIFEDFGQEIKQIGCQIVQLVCQNNSFAQNNAIQIGGFNIINSFIKDENIRNKESYLSFLSSLVRGEHFKGKRQFIDLEGIKFITQYMRGKEISQRCTMKFVSILQDFIISDSRLGDQKNDNTNFMNTDVSGSSEQSQDHYKDIVKKQLIEEKFDQIYIQMINETSLLNIDVRQRSTFIMENILIFDKQFISNKQVNFKQDKELKEKLKNHLNELQKIKNDQELYQDEIQNVCNLINLL